MDSFVDFSVDFVDSCGFLWILWIFVDSPVDFSCGFLWILVDSVD